MVYLVRDDTSKSKSLLRIFYDKFVIKVNFLKGYSKFWKDIFRTIQYLFVTHYH